MAKVKQSLEIFQNVNAVARGELLLLLIFCQVRISNSQVVFVWYLKTHPTNLLSL